MSSLLTITPVLPSTTTNMDSPQEHSPPRKGCSEGEIQDQHAVREVRKLVIDICRQNGGGHGGSAIGMAPMAVALWKYTMRYNPMNAEVRQCIVLPTKSLTNI